MSAQEAGPLRMMLTLGVAGLCSGLILVGVYIATAPRIERNRAEALEKAVFEVLPGSTSKRAFVRDGDAVVAFEEEGVPKGDAVFAGFDEGGNLIGFAIPAEGSGFQDVIGLIYGFDPNSRAVIGMRVLRSLETPGLGDKIIKDQDFVSNFDALAVDPQIEVTKKGRTKPNEVDAISGATISSKAVVRIINESNGRWLEDLPKVEDKETDVLEQE